MRIAAGLLCALLIAGCGGGGGGGGAGGNTFLSGTASQGVRLVGSDLASGEVMFDVALPADGTFDEAVAMDGVVLLEAHGAGGPPLAALAIVRSGERTQADVNAATTLCRFRADYLRAVRPHLTLPEICELAKREYELFTGVHPNADLDGAFAARAGELGVAPAELVHDVACAWMGGTIDADLLDELGRHAPPGLAATMQANAFVFGAAPMLQAVHPPCGGTEIEVIGLGFDASARATFGTHAAAATGALRFAVPPGAPGRVRVRVENEDGLFDVGTYTYVGGAATVTAVRPLTVPPAGGALVQLVGHGFDCASHAVAVGGRPAVVLPIPDPERLYVLAPAAPEGRHAVTLDGRDVGVLDVGTPAALPAQPAPPLHKCYLLCGREPATNEIFYQGARLQLSASTVPSRFTLQGTVRQIQYPDHYDGRTTLESEAALFDVAAISNLPGCTSALSPDSTRHSYIQKHAIKVTEYIYGDAAGRVCVGAVEGTYRDAVGFSVGFPQSTTRPPLAGDYCFTGFCFGIVGGIEETSNCYGTATFLDGRVSLTGLVTTRDEEGGGTRTAALGGHFDYTLDARGLLALPGTGFPVAEGAVAPDGGFGCFVLASDEKVGLVVFARRADALRYGNRAGARFTRLGRDVAATDRRQLLGYAGGVARSLAAGTDRTVYEADPSPPIETLAREDLFQNAGVLTDREGRMRGFACADGVVLAIPGGEVLGLGCTLARPAHFTGASLPPANVVGMGLELGVGTPSAPGRAFVTTTHLDKLRPGALRDDFAVEVLSDRVAEKVAARDAAPGALGPAADAGFFSGYAVAFLDNQLVAFPAPLPEEGTARLLKGCLSADGSVGLLSSTAGFDRAWCFALVKEPEAPPILADYDASLFGTDPPEAVQGAGRLEGGALLVTARTVHEDLTETTSELAIPGTLSVGSDGAASFGANLRGAATPDGAWIVLADVGPGTASRLVVLERGRPAHGVGLSAGLYVDFLGGGAVLAGTRAGRFCLRPDGTHLALDGVRYYNTRPGFDLTALNLIDLPLPAPAAAIDLFKFDPR